jgi:hypothetical protein
VQISPESYEELWPLWGTEAAVMFKYWDVARGNSWTLPDEGTILRPGHLGFRDGDLVTASEAMKRINWD